MAETILELVLRAHDQPQGARDLGSNVDQLNDLANYFHRLAAGGCKASSLVIRQDSVAASGTVTAAAVQNGDTVTLGGTVFTATQRHATGTVTIVIANTDLDDTVTIQGVVFTAKNAEDTAAGEFDISGTATAAATSLKACIDANATVSALMTCTTSAGVLTLRSILTGTAGNAYTLVSSDADGLAVSGSGTLMGGAATTTSTFDFTGTNAQTAAYLEAAIESHATTSVQFSASSASGVVTITSLVPGVIGNAISLASSNGTRLAVSAANLSGGTDGTKQTLTL